MRPATARRRRRARRAKAKMRRPRARKPIGPRRPFVPACVPDNDRDVEW